MKRFALFSIIATLALAAVVPMGAAERSRPRGGVEWSSSDPPINVTHIFDGACRLAPERLPYGAIQYFATDADGGLSPASFPVLFDRSA